MTIRRVFLGVTLLATRAWLRPVSRGNRHFTVGGGRLRQSGPRPETISLRSAALEGLTRSTRMDSPRQVGQNKFRRSAAAAAVAFERGEGVATFELGGKSRYPLGITDSACKNQLIVVSVQYGPFNPYIPIRSTIIGKSRVAKDPITMHTSWRSKSDIASVTSACVTLNDSRIQLTVGPQPLWLRNHNSGLSHRIMVKRLAKSPHDPLGITDSACKNQLVVVSVQYGPFNPYIPIRSTTIGKSRRGPTTIVAPESQFRTFPSDHGKASSKIAP
ncbi:hypothetical protein F511_39867 [Dorcoceras hygrometricum]|uniref:Uncharacterized protein n=1 Tax=Dorcoceras hygrometricum TaxID=472368 RepID=A0A2Z7AAQ2_9LAMI|nr:hypothetical protein F511_39867 [Dorcoceras hygrometricum]